MLDRLTAERVRRLVADIHSRDEIIDVYEVAKQIPVVNGGDDREAMIEFIAQEAIRLKASVHWDKAQAGMSVRLEGDGKPGNGAKPKWRLGAEST